MKSASILPSMLLFVFAASSHAQEWKQINDAEGILVWQRQVPDTSMVEFRSSGTVAAPLITVLGIIDDSSHSQEWLSDCAQNFEIERKSPTVSIGYNRTKSPAPFVSDRDVVLENHIILLPAEHTVRAEFSSVTDLRKQPVEDVVRMPHLMGHFALKQIDAQNTEVTYQLVTDPGGSIPMWLVNWAAKKLPFDTLKGLRAQVTREVYKPHIEWLRKKLDWTGFDLPQE